MAKQKLKDILDKNDITIYRVCKLMGLDGGSHARTKSMLEGKMPIKYHKLVKFCNSLSKYIHKPVKVEDLDVEIINVKV